jgi:hypothetical protein
MTDPDRAFWRRRFILMLVLQLGGTALALFGVVLWQSNYIVDGGSVAGFPLALVGLVVSFFGPRLLARHWRTKDGR